MAAIFMTHSPSPATAGVPPGAPTQVTSIAADGQATVSWLAPAVTGSSPITSYTVTPYVAGVAQTPTAVPVGSITPLQTAVSTFFQQAVVTGLTNATSYTFTVKAANGAGTGAESAQSGANTPQTNLIFGDEFNGSFLDPAWVPLLRDSDQSNSETSYYVPSQVSVDGSSHLQIVQAAYSGGARSVYTPDGNWPGGPFGTVSRTTMSGFVQMRYFNFKPGAKTIKVRAGVKVPGGNFPAVWMMGMLAQQTNSTGNTYNDGIGGSPDSVGPDRVSLLNNPNGVGGAWGFTSNWDNPGNEEIDVGEWVSSGGSINQQMFTAATGEVGGTFSVDFKTAVAECGIDWSNATLRWMTGSATAAGTGAAAGTTSTSTSSGVPTTPEFMMINMSSSVANGQSAGTMLVDYIRVFSV